MSKSLESRILKLEQYRSPRLPYVIRVGWPVTNADRVAIASAGRPVAVLPYKATLLEWINRYTRTGTLQ